MKKVLLSLALLFSCASFANDFNVLSCIDNLEGKSGPMYNLDLRYNTLEVRTSFFGSADLFLENCSFKEEEGSVVCNEEEVISQLLSQSDYYTGIVKELAGFSSRKIYCSPIKD